MNVFRVVIALVLPASGLAVGLQSASPQVILKLLVPAWVSTADNAIIFAPLVGKVVAGPILLSAIAWLLYSWLRKSSNHAVPVPALGAGL